MNSRQPCFTIAFVAALDFGVRLPVVKSTSFGGMEVKSSKSFQKSYLKGLRSLDQTLDLRKSFVIYLGDEQLKVSDTYVLPIMDF